MAACTTSEPVSASKEKVTDAARSLTGISHLVGAKGATARDQREINVAVARSCGSGVLTPSECNKHGEESRK